MIHHVTAKLAGMRKPQEFVVYPYSPDATDEERQYLKVQSNSVIGRFDKRTGEGVINWRGSNPKYNPHLCPSMGAEPYTFPMSFVLQCREMRPNSGDSIGQGIYIA